MGMSNQQTGRVGEDIAAKYLTAHGYRVIARNFKARYGELDIVAIKDKILVFVEVKTRLDSTYGTPEEAVTPRKLREIIKTSQYFKMKHPALPEAMRVDVIAIQLASSGGFSVRHIENVTS